MIFLTAIRCFPMLLHGEMQQFFINFLRYLGYIGIPSANFSRSITTTENDINVSNDQYHFDFYWKNDSFCNERHKLRKLSQCTMGLVVIYCTTDNNSRESINLDALIASLLPNINKNNRQLLMKGEYSG
jgi:hypothetical protein